MTLFISTSEKKSSAGSYISLLIITGLIGFPFMVAFGKLISYIFKIPTTTLDNYGWRGVGITLLLFGLFFIISIIIHSTGITLDLILAGLLFGALPIFIGYNLIKKWTLNPEVGLI